jgi:riboflavin kinase/FMN adenylyltransferase
MQHFYGLQDVHIQNAWLTIGSFDGVHLGHQKIIKQIIANAHTAGNPAAVLTFYPHPSVVLRGPRQSFYLTLPEEKARLLGEMGIDYVITHPFTRQVAGTSAERFIRTLKEHLGFKQLWVGHDFALGRDRDGDVPALKKFGETMNFSVQETTAYKMGGEIVSSSRIRRLLEKGQVEDANQLLGRTFSLTGSVMHGDGRGKQLGIPTANLSVNEQMAMPGAGVYACWATIDGQRYQAVTNVGVRPTFETEPVQARVEAHILDFSQEIYDRKITLEFHSFLRGEHRFDGPDALVAQIHQDIQTAKENLSISSQEED